MRLPTLRTLTGFICSLALFVACSDSPSIVEPDPPTQALEGRLAGEPQSPAVEGVRRAGPLPAPASEIGDDGLLRTRLRAVLAPNGTVEQVNQALELHQASIVSMRSGHYAVTLAVPEQSSFEAARALADALAATAGFILVRPAFELGAEAMRSAPAARDLPPSGTQGLNHWTLMRMPAAWNAAALAVDNGERVGALVPDWYGQLTPHPQIGSQSFSGNGTVTADRDHGFMMSGLIGANYNDEPVTGASPSPGELVGITSIPLGGLASWSDVFFEIHDQLPSSGRVVLSTSLGPDRLGPDREAEELFKDELIDRALNALFWREVFADDYDRFLHVGAAGNTADVSPGTASDVDYDAAWFVSARWDDPYNLIPQSLLTDQERLDLEAIFTSSYTTDPGTLARSPNVLAVGGSNAAGQRLAISNANEDIRTIAVDVASTCASSVSGCVGGIGSTTGTSAAAAMVSGIAAYLWNLSPTMSVADLKDRLLTGYQSGSLVPGLLDAYNLALALDGPLDIANARVRHTLLDVTGPGIDTPTNGAFDEEDIVQFQTRFQNFETMRDGVVAQQWSANPDYSRYDLNGNGITHEFGDGEDLYAGPFDLDSDGQVTAGITQVIEGQTLPFDEHALTDQDILCYYAYSDLYAGDLTSRRNLLGSLCGFRLQVEIGAPVEILEGLPGDLTIRVGRPGTAGIEWVEGAEVELTIMNGAVSTTVGDTDADGYFRTTVTGDPGLGDAVTITATATFGEYSGESSRDVTLRPVFEIVGSAGDGPRLQARVSTTHTDEGQQFSDLDSVSVEFETASVTASANAAHAYACQFSGHWTSDITSEVRIAQRVERTAGSLTYELELDGRSLGVTVSAGSNCTRPPVWPTVLGAVDQVLRITANVAGSYSLSVTYESSHPYMDRSPSVLGPDRSFTGLEPGYDETVTGTFEASDIIPLSSRMGFGVVRTASHDFTNRMTVRLVLTAN